MFSFFKRKKPAPPPQAPVATEPPVEASAVPETPVLTPDAPADAVAAPEAPAVAPHVAVPEAAPTPSATGVDTEPVSAAEEPTPSVSEPTPSPAEPPLSSAEPVQPSAELPSSTAEPVQPSAEPPPSTAEPVPPSPEMVPGVAEATPAQAEVAPDPYAVAPAQDLVAAAPAQAKRSWLSRLKEGLSRTGQSIGGIFVGVKVDEDLFEELETALIMADAGIEATEQLLTALRARVKKDRLTDAQAVKSALRDILAEHLAPLEKSFPLGTAQPLVIMIAGVNGAGKTTSIGKLAHAFQAQGASVLLAAADTFRAAAREQLMEWGARNNVTVVAQEGGDPAAVAFDAVNAGRARQAGVVMVDTAGRLPTQLHLMEELKKIKRVIRKADGSAPHEILLVVDGNTGQNVIAQVKAFDAAIELTGLVVTKLDGTAKGGTLAAIAAGSQGVRPVPVYWIGVGEGMHDLQPFVAREFASALLGE